jgi:NADH:ubiquinone reductase (H+-translocating)
MLDSRAQASAFNRSFLNAAMQVAEGQREHLSVGIVGAGATGVELAAELRHAAGAMKRYGGLGVEHIYAIGDCAAVPDGHGASALPATAQVAHQQASYLANALARRRRGKQVQPFIYRPRGSLVSLGPSEAAGEFPALRHGRPTVLARGLIPKLLYASLLHLHRAVMHGWMRAVALAVSDRLRRIAVPPVKLH